MATTRIALFVAATCLSACGGLRPWKLERLEYGIEHERVAELLEEPLIPVMRFFCEGTQGRERDVWIEVCEGCEPHPNYAFVSIDGRLESVTPVSGQTCFLGGEWWRDDHWDDHELAWPWWPHELQSLAVSAAEQRVDLAWQKLAPVDAAHHATGRYTAVGMATMLVIPLVLYTPYYIWRELFDGRYDRAAEARAFLLTAPRETTVEQVVAKLGPCTRERPFEWKNEKQRVLTYELPGSFRFAIGFSNGRLSWADFGSWYDWSWSFANMETR